MSQRGYCLFEVEDLPDCYAEIQEADATHGTAHPTRSDDSLQSLNAGLARSI